MDTYTITLIRPFPFLNRKIKNVVANDFPPNMNPGCDAVPGFQMEKAENSNKVIRKEVTFYERKAPVKFMKVTLANHRVIVINLDKYRSYIVHEDLFQLEAKNVKKESQGQADVS